MGAPCKLRPTPQLNTPAGRPSEGWEKVRVESLSPLCDPVDCSPPGSSVHGILQARTGVGHHFLLQGIFLTQGWNPGLLHGRQMLYRLSPPGKGGLGPGDRAPRIRNGAESPPAWDAGARDIGLVWGGGRGLSRALFVRPHSPGGRSEVGAGPGGGSR